MLYVRVNSKGQITLPREILSKLKIKPGGQMLILVDEEYTLLKLFTKTLLDLRGTVKAKSAEEFNRIRCKVLKKRAARNMSNER
jgi:AbrB family looped-hinge helix DNA binding protein